jgi:hypothetical protein
MIDYQLDGKVSASGRVTMEIVDPAWGAVIRRLSSAEWSAGIRRFSSADPPDLVNAKELNVPTYWVRPSRTLSASPGMHRFVWDLTYSAPDALSRDYPISAIDHDTPRYPLGATVLPGQYNVVLSLPGGERYTQPLTIRMDPRVKASEDDLRQQFDLDRKIADALHRDYQVVQQVRSLRAQLKSLTERKPSAEIAAKISDLETKAAALEGEDGPRYLSTPEGRSLVRLNSGLGTLLGALDSADAAPTTQQSAMFVDLEKALGEELTSWEKLKSNEVATLNSQLKPAGLPVIDLTKNLPEPANSAQTTSQDKDRNEE